jgi:integrase
MASLYKRRGEGRTGNWLAKYRGPNGAYLVRSTKTPDKAAAQRIATQWEAAARLRLEGVIVPEMEAETKAQAETIESLLKAFEAKLKAAGRTEDHVALTLLRLRRIAVFCGWKSARDIKAESLNRYTIDARAKRSAQTVAHELTVAKSFSGWLTKLGKLKSDPLRVVQKPSPATDRRHVRRMILPEEFGWLLLALSQGQERFGMTPTARGLLYWMALETGLRSKELRSLTIGSVQLDTDSPTVNLGAGQTKNRKGARQSISAGLAAELRDFANGEPTEPLFNLPRKCQVAPMLRADLEAARALWLADADCPEELTTREGSDFLKAKTGAGSLDFHSLRHSTGSWLARAGVSVPTIQRLMRHSDPSLTLNVYGHSFAGELQSAVGKVGEMVGVSLRPVGRFCATKNVTIGATKSAPKATLEAPAVEPSLRGGYCEDSPEKVGLQVKKVRAVSLWGIRFGEPERTRHGPQPERARKIVWPQQQ